MSVFSKSLPLLLSSMVLTASVSAAPVAPQTDAADVRRLMADYHAAVIAHDGARLAQLFVPAGSAWFTVLSDTGYGIAKAKSVDASKVRSSTVEGFIKFVSDSKAKLDPQHGPVTIQTDGAIASVYFDFKFMIDGKAQNRGSESWQLVRYPDGWRIASIVYSSTPLSD